MPRQWVFGLLVPRPLLNGAGFPWDVFEPVPLYIARARAGRKWDVDGHDYVDFSLGDTAAMAGHSPAPVVEAARRAQVSACRSSPSPGSGARSTLWSVRASWRTC